LYDTARGVNKVLLSNNTIDQQSLANTLTAFNSNGFTLGNSDYGNITNGAAAVSWSWAKAPKFFDVVTWTGDGTGDRAISHNLGSAPGFIVTKQISAASDWYAYHRSLGNSYYISLNQTSASATSVNLNWNVTSTTFTADSFLSLNDSGVTYVAYLFAHNAGGFGLTGTDNVISCGSYTGNGSATGPVVNLGYEPQWLLIKNASASPRAWFIYDNMRGMTNGSTDAALSPNSTDAEINTLDVLSPTATGFEIKTAAGAYNGSGETMIYIAIHRGPMKVPTSGTSVLGLNARTGTGANATVTGGQTDDAVLIKNRGSVVGDLLASRLTGTGYAETSASTAEVAAGVTILQANPWDVMDGFKVGTTSTITNASANTFINYLFKRAPSFFDVVCYTGTGANRTVAHNLAAVPELMIVKSRSGATNWIVYSNASGNTKFLQLNTTIAESTGATIWNNTTPTSSVFSLGTASTVNINNGTFVAYLFATCAGVSKVGSYTGTATTKQVDCGFTGGARFVLIKRTDSTGDWYVWDSARGIVSGNDPYLLLNSTAAEVTSTDYIDTYSAGFEISSTAPAAINASGGTFIFLAIA